MNCPSCGAENLATNRFCGGCGGALARVCSACGHANSPDHRFCGACGAPLVAPSESAPSRVDGSYRRTDGVEARKVVTVVFADLIGSTALHERLDAESVRGLMGRYYGALHAVVDSHGGRVVKLLGDGVMAAFGLPRVAEDDAVRAVRAAVAMQQAVRALAREQSAAVGALGLRVAVNTGEVVVEAATDDVVGDPINVAARLQDAAQDGDVVIGEATRRLVGAVVTLAPLGPVALRGRAETVAVYRVVSLERPGGASAVAFVGREEELGRLAAVYDAARAAPAARLAVVLGSPGVGKSRLLDEFTRRLDGTTVLVAYCEAAGGATFAPLAQALRAVLGVGAGTGGYDLRRAIDAAVPGSEADRDRIAAGIGALLAGTPAAPEETFFVVRRLLTGLAAAQPVVLVLDDLQWAEPLLLDLLEHLVQWSTGVPLLLLAAARPDLRDARSALAAPGKLATDVVMLGGLDAVAATRLAANVLGADALPATVAGRVLATSEGNPLFLGELVRMLVDDGALRREGDRWTAGVDLAAVDMPPTIHALLAARIERLRAEDRLVLERAAIVGRQFSRAAVAHLLPREAQGELDARVEALRRSELIEPDATWFLGEPALRFHHGLIRDAAYRRVLKGTRAELHERVADWIEGRVGEAVEHDETIGWHLEQAHRHLSELGPLDASGRALGERAARYLAAAGRRALGRDDLPPAASLLGRALARLDPADPARADLALDWCEALLEAGDVGPAAQALDELARFTDGSERLRAWHTCFAAQRAVLTDPQTLQATVDAVAGAAATLAAADDGAGEAKAHAVHARALARLGQVGASEAALDKALAAARRADDRRRANAVLAGAPLAALWGPSPVTRASGRCLDVVRVLRITQGAPGVEAVALRCQAVLEALRGRGEAARRMIASSRHMVEELGITQGLLETEWFTGLIELIEGDTAAAERSLRAAYDGLRSHGLGIDAARAAGLLGRTLLAQGRAAEAEALSDESEALAGDDLQAAITWRRVRAEALAQRGDHAAAVQFARAAVDIAAATDALLQHAEARLALAAALRAAGRRDEADAEEKRAIELWEAKGATVLAERARHALGRVEQVERAPNDRAEPVRAVRRRVGANAATANAARLDAAIAARDPDALATDFADESETLDHTTRTTWDRAASLASFRSLPRVKEPTSRHAPLAILGDSLALCRLSTSASGFAGATFDVGPYQREEIDLVEVDARGRRRRTEIFAADHLGDAVVRLYERYAEILPDGPERDRSTATARSVAAPLLGPVDLERFATALCPAVEFVDHRPVGLPSSRGSEALVRSLGALLEAADGVANRVDDVLALRSDALALRLTNFGTERIGGGAWERPLVVLWVYDADGLLTDYEFFDLDCDAEALARFDELTAEPATGRVAAAPSQVAKTRQHRVRPNAATANAARVDAAIAARDVDAFATLWADESEAVAHETGTTWDRQGSVVGWRSLLRTRNPTSRHEPLATLGDSLALCRWATSASGFAGRTFDIGAYEREEITLVEVDAQGRRRRTEAFAAAHLGDAITRLYERYADLLPDGPARARAAATARTVAGVMGPYDPERYASTLSPTVEVVDQRTLGTFHARGTDAFLAHIRAMLEVADDIVMRADEILALEPDALLVRWIQSGTGRAGGGAYEMPFILLVIFGPDGLSIRSEFFDADREAEAIACFDELVAASRAVRFENAATRLGDRFVAAWATRDWEGLAALFAPGFRLTDRRSYAHLDLDRDQHLESLRFRFEMRSSRTTLEVLATRGHRLALLRQRFELADGDVGPSETESLIVAESDEHAHYVALVTFDPDDLDAAYAELDRRNAAGEAAAHGPVAGGMGAFVRRADAARDPLAALAKPNAATAAMERVYAAIEARDWAAMRAACTADAKIEDRRRHVLVSLDTDGWIADERRIAEDVPEGRYGWRLVGTTGDRVQLEHVLWRGGPAGGISEIQYLWLTEVDDRGLVTAAVAFDPDDWRAASADCLARALAVDAAAAALRPIYEFALGLNDHDLAGARAACADDLVVHDHRLAGLGLVEGADAYVESIAALWRLVPDDHFEAAFELARERYGVVAGVRSVGTLPEGGSFERPIVHVSIVAGGRITRIELFEPEDVDAALARFAELRPDPLRIPPNAATRARDRFWECIERQDWGALRALCAPIVWEDRRRLIRTTGNCDTILANGRLISRAGTRMSRTLLATAGDRLMLQRQSYTGPPEGPIFETETLELIEVDAEGRVVALITFDPDDRRAASMEMLDRYARSDAAGCIPAAMFEALRAVNAHDLDRFRAVMSDDFVLNDHRRTGLGRLEREDYLASLAALFEHAPDVSVETLYLVAVEKHGMLLVARNFGILRDGGEFESPYVRIMQHQGDRLVGVEMFEPEHLDLARARFEELRPDPTRIPPNAAWRARERWQGLAMAHDWDGCRALASADFTYEDRRKYALVTGDIEVFIKSNQEAASWPRLRVSGALIGTAGDRIMVERVAYTGGADAGAFEIDFIRLIEVAADGRLVAWIAFDVEDRSAAFAEARERFAAGEAAAIGGQAPVVALQRAFAHHDWQALRGCLAPAAVVWDRRALGVLGVLDRDRWVESVRTLAELAPDVEGEILRIVTWNHRGHVDVFRQFGTILDGGPFEHVLVRVLITDGLHIQRYELFDVADTDRAVARFAELSQRA